MDTAGRDAGWKLLRVVQIKDCRRSGRFTCGERNPFRGPRAQGGVPQVRRFTLPWVADR